MDIEAPFIVIIVLVVSIALLYAWYLACREFGRIADAKGWAGSYYFHFCFWMGLIGMLMVIALPDRKGASGTPAPQPKVEPGPVPVAFADFRKVASAVGASAAHIVSAAKAASVTPAPTPVFSAGEWQCTCGRVNKAHRCVTCAAWRCSCGMIHPAHQGTCDSCGETKPR